MPVPGVPGVPTGAIIRGRMVAEKARAPAGKSAATQPYFFCVLVGAGRAGRSGNIMVGPLVMKWGVEASKKIWGENLISLLNDD